MPLGLHVFLTYTQVVQKYVLIDCGGRVENLPKDSDSDD